MTDQIRVKPRDERAIAAASGLFDQTLRIKAVSLATGLSKATIYRMIARDEFPHSTPISPGSVGWFRSEIEAWMARIRERRANH